MNFNYNHLFYFYQTAKLGGITAAAKSLRVSQPSLSLQLKTLESQTGIALFRKHGRNLVLTEDGHEVFAICRTMFEAAEELDELRQNTGEFRRRRIAVGVDNEVERPFAAAIVGRFLKTVTPQPHVMMVSGTQSDLIERLRGGNIDLVFGSMPAYYSDVLVVSQSKMAVTLCCGKRLWSELKPLHQTLTLAQFMNVKKVNWVLPSSKLRLRQAIDLHLVNRRALGHVVFESDILAAVVRAVAEEVGVSCLPLAYIGSEMKTNQIKPLYPNPPLWTETLYLLTRRGHEKMPFADALAEAAKAEIRN